MRRATGYTVNFHAKPGFLSTLSLRRATARRASRQHPAGISIHALLAESDRAPSITPTPSRNFYPRSPCGERQHPKYPTECRWQFLSTLSLRRATPIDVPQYQIFDISIHALLAESDHPIGVPVRVVKNFYPRSPCGERHISFYANYRHLTFLSTLSLRRATINGLRHR